MAIAFDAVSVIDTHTGTSHTISHTCSGANRILFVMGRNRDGAFANVDRVTGVTYNGVSLTKITSIFLDSPADYDYFYYLINPDIGTHNIVVNCSASSVGFFRGVSYNGVKQTGFPDSSASSRSTTGSSITATTTTVADNCWLVGLFDNEVNTQTAGANTVIRNGGNQVIVAVDSNGAQTPAGSKSMTSSWTGSGTNYYSIVSIAPFVVSGSSNFFQLFN